MVKPVDLQDNLSKTQLVEKVQQLHKSTPEEAQKQFAHELQKKVSEGKERVADLPKSDQIIIKKDEDKRKDEQKKQERKKQSESQKKDKNKSDEKNKIDYIA